jgi:hypothetical protein
MDGEYNTAFNFVNSLCEPMKNMLYTVRAEQFFSNSKPFYHLWTANTNAVQTVTSNCKEMHNVQFQRN